MAEENYLEEQEDGVLFNNENTDNNPPVDGENVEKPFLDQMDTRQSLNMLLGPGSMPLESQMDEASYMPADARGSKEVSGWFVVDNPLTGQRTQEYKPTPGKKPVDYLMLKTIGQSDDENINEMIFANPEYEVNLLPYDDSKKIFVDELGMDAQTFDEAYSQASSEFAKFKKGHFNQNPKHAFLPASNYGGINMLGKSGFEYVGSAAPMGYGTIPGDTRFEIGVNGRPVRVKTDMQWVRENNMYLPITAEGTNKDEAGHTWLETKYHDFDIPAYGGKIRGGNIDDWVANRSAWEHQVEDTEDEFLSAEMKRLYKEDPTSWVFRKFRKDYNESTDIIGLGVAPTIPGGDYDYQTQLVMDYLTDDLGNQIPVLKEVFIGEHGTDPNSVLTSHGPRQMYSGFWENAIAKGTDWIDNLNSDMWNIADYTFDFGDMIVGKVTGTSPTKYRVFDRISDMLIGYGNAYSKTVPMDVEKDGMFGSASGFGYSFGGAIGSIAQMLLTRKVGTGVAKGVAKSARKAITKKIGKDISQITKAEIKSLGRIPGKKMALGLPGFATRGKAITPEIIGGRFGGTLLAMSAAGQFKRTAEQMGVKDDHLALMYGPALVGSFLIERSGSNIIDDGLKSHWMKKEINDKFVREQTKNWLKAIGKTQASQMTNKEAKGLGRHIWAAMQKGILNYKSVKAQSPLIARSFVEEGREEVMEGQLFNTLNSLHDMFKLSEGKYGDASKKYQSFSFFSELDEEGVEKFYEKNRHNGVVREISKGQFDDGVKKVQLRPGKGLTGRYNPEESMFYNWYDRTFNAKEAAEEAILGGLAGGLTVGLSQGIDAFRIRTQENQMINAVASGEADIYRTALKDNMVEGNFMPKGISIDDEALFGGRIYRYNYKLEDENGKKIVNPTYEDIIAMKPELANDEKFEKEVGSPAPDENTISANTLVYKAALLDLEVVENLYNKIGITDAEVLKDNSKKIMIEAYDNLKEQEELAKELSSIEEGNEQAKLEIEKKLSSLKLQLQNIRNGNRASQEFILRSIDQYNKIEKAPKFKGSTVSAYQLKRKNDQYDKLRQEKIQEIEVKKKGKAEIEAEIEAYNKKDPSKITVDESVTLTQKINEELSRNPNISVEKLNKYEKALATVRDNIVDNIGNYLTGKELETFQESMEKDSTYKIGAFTFEEFAEKVKGTEEEGEGLEVSNELKSAIDFDKESEKLTAKAKQLRNQNDNSFNKFLNDELNKEENIGYKKIQENEDRTPEENNELEEFTQRKRSEFNKQAETVEDFDDKLFKVNFYSKYQDEEGNTVDIQNELLDLSIRSLQPEDKGRIANIYEAIDNQMALAGINNFVFSQLKDSGVNLRTFEPSQESIVNESELTAIAKRFEGYHSKAKDLDSELSQEMNSITIKESNHAFNYAQIKKRSLTTMFSTNFKNKLSDETSAEIGAEFIKFDEQARKVLDTETRTVLNDELTKLEGILAKIESLFHNQFKQLTESELKEVIQGGKIASDAETNTPAGGIATEYMSIRNKERALNSEPMFPMSPYYVANDFSNGVKPESLITPRIHSFPSTKQHAETNIDFAKISFERIFFSAYLNQIIRYDSKEFYINYKKSLDSDLFGGKVMSPTQKVAFMQVAAFLKNSSDEALKYFDDAITKTNKSANATAYGKTKVDDSIYLPNSINVRGFAGVGKTQMAAWLDAWNKLYNESNQKTLAVAFSEHSSLNLSKDMVEVDNMTFDQLISEMSNDPEGFKKRNIGVIYVDEHSLINHEAFRNYARLYDEKGFNHKTIFLGDGSQMSSFVEVDRANFTSIDGWVEKTSAMFSVFRTGAADIANFQQAIRDGRALDEKTYNIPVPNGKYSKGRESGLEYSKGDLSTMYTKFAEDVISKDQSVRDQTYLIVLTNKNREDAIAHIQNNYKGADELTGNYLTEHIKTLDDREVNGENFSAQGYQYGRVYLAIDQKEVDDKIFLSALLTGSSRATANNGLDDNYYGYVNVLFNHDVESAQGEVINITEDIQTGNKQEQEVINTEKILNEFSLTKDDSQEIFNSFKADFRNKFSIYSYNKQSEEYNLKGSTLAIERASNAISKYRKNQAPIKPTTRDYMKRGTLFHELMLEFDLQKKLSKQTENKINELVKKFNNDKETEQINDVPLFDLKLPFWKNFKEAQKIYNENYKKTHNLVEKIIGLDRIAGRVDQLGFNGDLNEKGNPLISISDLKATSNFANYDVNVQREDRHEILDIEGIEFLLNRGTEGLLKNQIYAEIIKQSGIQAEIQENELVLLEVDSRNNINMKSPFKSIKLNEQDPKLRQDIETIAKAIVEDHRKTNINPGNINYDFQEGVDPEEKVVGNHYVDESGRWFTIYAIDKTNTSIYYLDDEGNSIDKSQILNWKKTEVSENIDYSKYSPTEKDKKKAVVNEKRFEDSQELFLYAGNPIVEDDSGLLTTDEAEAFVRERRYQLINQLNNPELSSNIQFSYRESVKIWNEEQRKFIQVNDVLADESGMITIPHPKVSESINKVNAEVSDLIKEDGEKYRINYEQLLGETEYNQAKELIEDNPVDKKLLELWYTAKKDGSVSGVFADYDKSYYHVKYKAKKDQSLNDFIETMKGRGYSVRSFPVFYPQAYIKDGASIASWGIDFEFEGISSLSQRVLLKTRKANSDYYKELKKDLTDNYGEGSLESAIKSSKAAHFIRNNSPILLTNTKKRFSSQYSGLSQYLKTPELGKSAIEIQGRNAKEVLKSLTNAIDILSKNNAGNNLFQSAPIEINQGVSEFNGSLEDAKNIFLTQAENISFNNVFLNFDQVAAPVRTTTPGMNFDFSRRKKSTLGEVSLHNLQKSRNIIDAEKRQTSIHTIFDNYKNAENVIRYVGGLTLKLSPYNPNLEMPVLNREEVYNEFSVLFKSYYDQQGINKDTPLQNPSGNFTTIGSITGKTYSKLDNETDKRNYALYQINDSLENPKKNKLVKEIMDSIDPQNYGMSNQLGYKSGEDLQSMEDNQDLDVDNDLKSDVSKDYESKPRNSNNQLTSLNDSNMATFGRTMGHLIQSIIKYTKVNSYNNSGQILDEDLNEYLDLKYVAQEIKEAANRLWSKSSQDIIEDKSDMEIIREYIQSKIQRYKKNGDQKNYNHLQTFMDVFLYEGNGMDPRLSSLHLSYWQLSQNRELIKNTVIEGKTQKYIDETVDAKSNFAGNVIGAIMNHLASQNPIQLIKVEYENGKFAVTKRGVTEADEINRELKQSFTNRIFSYNENDNQVVIDSDFFKAMRNFNIRFKKESVEFINNQQDVFLEIKKQGNRYSYEFNDDLTNNVESIKSLFRAIGLQRNIISDQTLTLFYNNALSQEQNAPNRMNLARMLGTMVLSATDVAIELTDSDSRLLNSFKENSITDSNYQRRSVTDDILDSYYNQENYSIIGPEFDNFRNQTAAVKKIFKNNGIKQIKSPLDQVRDIRLLADTEAERKQQRAAHMSRNIDGELVNLDVNGNTFRKKFPKPTPGKNSDYELKNFGQEASKLGRSLIYGPSRNLANDKMSEKIFNSILNPKSEHRVLNRFEADGIRNITGFVSKAQKAGRMSYINTAQMNINGLFMTDIIQNRKKQTQTFKLMHHTTGKTLIPVLEHRWGQSPLYSIGKNGELNLSKKAKNIITRSIIDNLYYFENAKNISLSKWKNVYTALTPSKKQAERNWGKLVNPVTGRIQGDSIANLIASFNQIENIDEILRSEGLSKGSDYVIVDGQVQAGPRVLFQHDDIYNEENFIALSQRERIFEEEIKKATNAANARISSIEKQNKKKLKKEEKEQILEQTKKARNLNRFENDYDLINSFFEQQERDLGNDLKNNNFRLEFGSLNHNDSLKWPMIRTITGQTEKKDPETGETLMEDGKPVMQDQYRMDVNPYISFYNKLWHIADFSVSQIIMGDSSNYGSVGNYFKRSSGPMSPSYLPNTSTNRGFGRSMRIAVVDDLMNRESYDQLQFFNELSKINSEDTDGLFFMFGVQSILMRNMFANEDGVMGKGGIKGVYQNNNLFTNEGEYLKYAGVEIENDHLKHSKLLQEVEKKTLPQDILKLKYDEKGNLYPEELRVSDEEIAEMIIRDQRQGEIIGQVIFNSGVKSGPYVVNNINDEVYETSTLDMNYYGIQLNPEQDINDTSISSPATIEAVQVGSNSEANIERLKAANDIRSKIADQTINAIKNKISDKNGVINPLKLEAFARRIGMDSAKSIDDNTSFGELIQDPNMSLDIPSIRTKLIQLMSNKITKEGIKPAWTGVRMTQMPGFMFDIKRVNGRAYMSNTLSQDIGETSQLQPMKLYSDSAQNNEIESKEVFDELLESQKETGEQRIWVKAAEVVMPFSYFKQFGLEQYIEENPDANIQDIFMLKDQNGNIVATPVIDNIRNNPNDEAYKKAFKEEIDLIKAGSELGGYNGFMLDFFRNDSGKLKSTDEIYDWYMNFIDSLQIMYNRTPSGSMGAIGKGEVVGWIRSTGNVVYTSSLKNILDGGDYDIDALGVYFRSVDKNGKIIRGNTKEGMINQMWDLMHSFFDDADNAKLFMSPIDFSELQKLSEINLEENLPNHKRREYRVKNTSYNSAATNFYYAEKSAVGENLIGEFQNSIKNYSYLMQAVRQNPNVLRSNLSNKFNLDGINEMSGKNIIDEIEAFSNAALDNFKNVILGPFGLENFTGYMASAAVIQGIPLSNFQRMITSPVIWRAFSTYKSKNQVTEVKSAQLIDIVEDMMIHSRNKIEEQKEEAPNPVEIQKQIEELASYEDRTPIEDSKLLSLQEQLDSIENNEDQTYWEKRYQILEDFRVLMLNGEALKRMTSITRMDTNGLHVFDFEIKRSKENIEFNLGAKIEDVISGKRKINPKNIDSEMSFVRAKIIERNPLATTEEIENLIDRERIIRGNFSLAGVIQELPQFKSYLNSSEFFQNDIMSNLFVEDQFFMQNVTDKFLAENKIGPVFNYRKQHYSYMSEKNKFLTQLFLSNVDINKKYRDILKDNRGNTITISDQGQRTLWGMQFPQQIMDTYESAKSKSVDERSSDEESIAENLFLNELFVTSTSNGTFLQIKNFDQIKNDNEKIADLRSSFSRLPLAMRQKFGMYELITNNLSRSKSGFSQVIDKAIYVDYSNFLEHFKYQSKNENSTVEVIESGKSERISLAEMFDIFNTSVLYYSNDMPFLRSKSYYKGLVEKFEKSESSKNMDVDAYINQFPSYFSSYKKYGQYGKRDMVENNKSNLFGKFTLTPTNGYNKKTFNPYSLLSTTFTRTPVIKRLSEDNLREIQDNQEINIYFGGKTTFEVGDLVLLHGGIEAKVTGKLGNQLIVKRQTPSKIGDYINAANNNIQNNKKAVLTSIINQSESQVNKHLANLWYDSPVVSNTGSILFRKEEDDVNLIDSDDTVVNAYYNYENGNIIINQSRLDTSNENEFERIIMHEMAHPLTNSAFYYASLKPKEITQENAEIVGIAKAVVNDVEQIFEKAKEASKDGLINADHNGLTSLREFWSESLSDVEFQQQLRNIETVSGQVEEKTWIKSLWDGFLNAIGKLFGIKGKNVNYTSLEQMFGLTNYYAQNYNKSKIKGGDKLFSKQKIDRSVRPADKVIRTTRDVIDVMSEYGQLKSSLNLSDEQLLNSIRGTITTSVTKKYYTPDGSVFEFAKSTEAEIQSTIRNEIIPIIKEYKTKFNPKMVDWLNEGGLIENSASSFPKRTNTSKSRFNDKTLEELKAKINYSVNDKFYRYSELQELGINIPFNENFIGYDPIVVVHSEAQDSYSLLDITTDRVQKSYKIPEQGNVSLFSKYFNKRKLKANKIKLSNTEAGRRKFALGMTALAIKNANPDIKLNYLTVIGMTNEKVNDSYLDMNEDFMPMIPGLTDNSKFMNILPEEMKTLLNSFKDKKLVFNQPWLQMLRQQLENKRSTAQITGSISERAIYKIYTEPIDQIKDYYEGKGSSQEMLEMVNSRMQDLQSQYPEDQLHRDPEWALLSRVHMELKGNTFEDQSIKDISFIAREVTPVHNIDHKVLNWVQEKIAFSKMSVSEHMNKWQKEEFFPRLQEYNKRYMKQNPGSEAVQKSKDFLLDLTGKKFDKMFKRYYWDENSKQLKKYMINDIDGNLVDFNPLEIHWNINDKATKAAVNDSSNLLTKEDVEFGKWLMDQIEEEMIQQLIHSNRSWKKSDGEKYTREDAVEQLNKTWRKGSIAAMPQSVNEMLQSGQIKKGAVKFWNKISNEEYIYDEFQGDDVKMNSDERKNVYIKEIPEYFMSQIGTESDYGSSLRLNMLGIQRDANGNLFLVDPKANQLLNQNLELLGNYFMHNGIRKRIYETELLPSVNAAQAILHTAKESRLDGTQPNAIKYLKIFADATILGKAKEIGGKLEGFDLDALTNAMIQMTSFTALAWNVPVALTSAMMNTGQFVNLAVANDAADNGFFGKKEAMKAVSVWVKGGQERKKMFAIAEAFLVSDMGERAIINHPRRRQMTKNAFNSWTFNIGNWFTDHNIRVVTAYAQMLKDGSINAYSYNNGKVTYDESKDPQWKGEFGKELKKHVKQEMVDQNIIESVDSKMPYGYDRRMQRSLKTLADREIIGSMDEMSQINLSKVNGWRALTTFKSYLPDKMHNYLGKNMKSPIMGTYKPKKEGEEILTEFERIEQEGILRTLVDGIIAIKNAKSQGVKGWSELSTVKKRNLTKLAMDVGSMIVMYAIFAGLTADWDDEKEGKQQILPEGRFTRVFKNASLDYLTTFAMIYNSKEMFSIPVLNQTERLIHLMFGDVDQITRLAPGASTIRSIGELIPEGEE